MDTQALHEDVWPYVVTLLPGDLEESARKSGALVRCRNVPDAAALIRMALAYAVSDLSLKDVAAWAHAMEVAQITGPGLFYRLREAEAWLEQVLAATLQAELPGSPLGLVGRVRIVDATVITGPGSQGTDWRVHVVTDPATGTLHSVELTDAHGGEGYGRHRFGPGELFLGDRGYATARGIAAVRKGEAHVVVRVNPHTIRLCDEERRVLDLAAQAAAVPLVGPKVWDVTVPVPPNRSKKSYATWPLTKAQDWIPARLVGARTRTRAVIWVLTTAPATLLSPVQILRLYRLRWQVELVFKRLKSLLHVDTLPTRHGPTAKSWLLARFLAAALAQRLAPPIGPLSPWGYELREPAVHPERLVTVPHRSLGSPLRHSGARPLARGPQRGTSPAAP